MTFVSRFHRWAGGVLLLALLAGCGGGADVPKTYPVQGKIVFKGAAGDVRKLVGGRVRLQSMTDPGLGAGGEIQEGGVFALGCYIKEKSLPGAPAGKYRVAIEPPSSDEDDRPRRAVIQPKYQDFDKSGLTMTVPVEGEVVLTVEPFRR